MLDDSCLTFSKMLCFCSSSLFGIGTTPGDSNLARWLFVASGFGRPLGSPWISIRQNKVCFFFCCACTQPVRAHTATPLELIPESPWSHGTSWEKGLVEERFCGRAREGRVARRGREAPWRNHCSGVYLPKASEDPPRELQGEGLLRAESPLRQGGIPGVQTGA